MRSAGRYLAAAAAFVAVAAAGFAAAAVSQTSPPQTLTPGTYVVPPSSTITETVTLPAETTTVTVIETVTVTTPTTTVEEDPPFAGGANVAVAVDGNDSTCARGDPARPCLTFNRAYMVAECGDTVAVQAGSYPGQTFTAADKACAGDHIVFKPEAAGAVTVDQIHAQNGPDWIELNGLTVTNRVQAWDDTNDWRIINVDGGSFELSGARYFLSGNDWGPCVGGNPGLDCNGQNFLNAADVTVDGDTFHDFTIQPDSGAHFECLFVLGVRGQVTIRNSRFYNCHTYAIFFQGRLSNHVFSGAMTIENNWFGRTCCFGANDRDSSVTFASPNQVSNVLIRFNSFAAGQSVTTEGGVLPTNTRIVGNILGRSYCQPGWTWEHNVTLGQYQCPPSNRAVTSLPYVNGSSLGDGDYHLDGPSVADGLVTATGPDYQLEVDRDGDARAVPRDAGSDER